MTFVGLAKGGVGRNMGRFMSFRYSAPRPKQDGPSSTALVLIDQRPLQQQAWAEFKRAQRLQEKAAQDLHRHENTDMPAYVRWLHTTFAAKVSEARELHAKVMMLAGQVQQVQRMAMMTGRSYRDLWQEYKEYRADPEAFERKMAEKEAAERAEQGGGGPEADDDDDDLDDFFDGLFGRTSKADGDARGREAFSDDGADGIDFFKLFGERESEQPPARDIYRRLVQHLHPDRGGEWTSLRERVWHEVQQAWAARDVDWLARLEIEWETAHDVINEHSALGRLREAIEELHAARRDVQRKLRNYRKAPSWRFTLTEKKRVVMHKQTEAELSHDIAMLRRELAELEYTIEGWELPRRSSRSSNKPNKGRGRGRRG